MNIYILTIPFRAMATILAILFLPLIILLDAVSCGNNYVNDIIKDLFINIWN